jgi:hypothetical protein
VIEKLMERARKALDKDGIHIYHLSMDLPQLASEVTSSQQGTPEIVATILREAILNPELTSSCVRQKGFTPHSDPLPLTP